MSDESLLGDSEPHDGQPLRPLDWLDEHGDALFAFAILRVKHAELAEDLVQETLLAGIKAAPRFDGRSSVRTWLIGILKRKIVDHYRRSETEEKHLRHAVQTQQSSPQNPKSASPWHADHQAWKHDPSATLQSTEFWSVFEECRSKMPPKLLSAFVLREMDRISYSLICKQLGISATNLSVRLYRARMYMRRCLELNWFHDESS